MTDLEKAARQALEALEVASSCVDGYYVPKGKTMLPEVESAITALRTAIEQAAVTEPHKKQSAERGEPVTILPDGSAFGVMSFPLPDDHWLYAPNEYRDGEYEPIDLPKPILTHALRESVVAAVRYAVRGATMRGQETDFDPDALVQNAVYALCGPYTTPPAAPVQEQFGPQEILQMIVDHALEKPAAQRQWVSLTDEQIMEVNGIHDDPEEWPEVISEARAIETKLRELNGGNQ